MDIFGLSNNTCTIHHTMLTEASNIGETSSKDVDLMGSPFVR